VSTKCPRTRRTQGTFEGEMKARIRAIIERNRREYRPVPRQVTTRERAAREAMENGLVAAGLARRGNSDLAAAWARSAASYALVILGREENSQADLEE
jgi:hypothetical protein